MLHQPENWFISDVFDVEYEAYQIIDCAQKTQAHFEIGLFGIERVDERDVIVHACGDRSFVLKMVGVVI